MQLGCEKMKRRVFFLQSSTQIAFQDIIIWAVFQIRVPFRVLFIRVPYHIGDLKKDPSLSRFLRF